MRPSYAHIPDAKAGGTCGDCLHAVHEEGTRPWTNSWCRKACELARYSGRGREIEPRRQGCKYWEWKGN